MVVFTVVIDMERFFFLLVFTNDLLVAFLLKLYGKCFVIISIMEKSV